MLHLPILGTSSAERASRGPSRVGAVSPSAAADVVQPRSVRLSLTDRCDLACVYCRPHRNDGYVDRRLDLESWKAMVEGLILAGVRRVRLTGGEPLLHRDVVEIVTHLASLSLDDLALTTNATQLSRLAAPLRSAGLRRVTVSLDTLDPARFAKLTRGGELATVLEGIGAACAAGFEELKLNVVVVRGENDDELERLVEYAWQRGITPRFLEVMPIGEGATMRDRVVPVREMQKRLSHLLVDGAASPDPDRGPARYLVSRESAALRVGFISGTTDTYCQGCDRLRVSSDGVLRPCLATNEGVDAQGPARARRPEEVSELVREAWTMKPDGSTFRGCTEESASSVSIRAIGG